MLYFSYSVHAIFFLIFSPCNSKLPKVIRIIFITMKKIPHVPHIMQARCRLCGSSTSFFVKHGNNSDFSDSDIRFYEEITQSEYIGLKRTRLKNRLDTLASHLAKCKYSNHKSKFVIELIRNFDYHNVIIKQNKVYYNYNDTFPLKYLKHIFSSLKINLIGKKQGGQDE